MTAVLTALLYFVNDFLKITCLILIGRDIFGSTSKNRGRLFFGFLTLLVCVAVLAVVPLGLSMENQRMLTDTCSFLLCIMIPLTQTKLSRRSIWIILLTAMLLDFTADTLYSLVARIASDALWWESAFGAAVFLVVLIFLRYTGRRSKNGSLRGAFVNIPPWTWGVLLFFEFTCYYRTFGEALSWYNVFASVSVIAVLLTLFFLIWKILFFAQRQDELLQQMALQKEFGEKLQRSDDELRAFRHDYKNHLIVVCSFLESGNINAAKSYFDSVNSLSAEALRRVSTGNFAADALLNYKMKTAEESGVHLHFDGDIPAEGMRDEDLCTILSNLLDNAVEAAAQLDGEKSVQIEAVTKNGFFLLCVTNPTGNASQKRKGKQDRSSTGGKHSDGRFAESLPTTTKADKKNHGYGLKNVRRTVQKYGGSFTATKENGTFTASVRIKVPKADTVNSAI